MHIVQTWSKGARKLCHRKAGDLIQLEYNDGKVDKALYMVISGKAISSRGNASVIDDNLVDIKTGLTCIVHTSTRCVHFPEAIVVPEPDKD